MKNPQLSRVSTLATTENTDAHTVAELIVDSLPRNGVRNLYCLPGLQLDPFFNAAYDRQRELRVVHTRHEQAAAYMATGAAHATGKPQAFCVVPGAGFLNATAALATALSTHARVLALVGEIPQAAMGKGYGVLHEIPDGPGILSRLTKASCSIDNTDTAETLLNQCWQQLNALPPGPVGLSIPLDLWNQRVPRKPQHTSALESDPVDADQLQRAADLISAAKSPLIIVGSGALDSAADVRTLAAAVNAPVVAFRMGQGLMSADSPLSISMPVAHALWPKVDLVIGLGTRMQTQTMTWGTDASLKIIHINANAHEIGRICTPTVGICADLADALPPLLQSLQGNAVNNNAWFDTVQREKQRTAKRIADKLAGQLGWLAAIRAELPHDGILIDEVTQIGYVSRFAYPVYEPRTFITPGYQATLGYGYATALGVADSRRDVPVVNFCGDGGALFTLNEIATAVQHNIPLTTIIFTDGHFGNVRGIQRDQYDQRYIATSLSNPDFVKYAEAFGAQGLRATTPDALRAKLREGMKHDGPTLIEVPVGEFASPWEFILMPKNRGN